MSLFKNKRNNNNNNKKVLWKCLQQGRKREKGGVFKGVEIGANYINFNMKFFMLFIR